MPERFIDWESRIGDVNIVLIFFPLNRAVRGLLRLEVDSVKTSDYVAQGEIVQTPALKGCGLG